MLPKPSRYGFGHLEPAVSAGFAEETAETAVCELVLMELYTLLRNPKVCARPLSAGAASEVVQSFRRHPYWRVLDYAPEIADEMWALAARSAARLRIYDIRLALTLRHHGVTEFATRNVKDFQGFGFTRVWDPLADA
ncbi:MAG: PIN domain-containing protein [Kiritimatiellae bacterium]|nr:PIN domain-containing protein [Kiritimatiellia bacterium]